MCEKGAVSSLLYIIKKDGAVNKMPKYIKLVNWIKEQIETKKLSPGAKLYSENELSEMFDLSRQTVRHAISVLEQEGLLKRVRGSGTYVTKENADSIGKRNRITLIMTYLDGYIFPRTIQAIEDVLFKAGYTVQIAFTNNLVDRERKILEDILQRDEVAGVMVEATKSALPNPNIHFYRELMERKIPVLFINCYYKELPLPHVAMNDRLAGKAATEYLIKKGHKKITGIFKLDDGQGHLRYAGFGEALQEANLTYNESKIIWIDTEDTENLMKIKEKIRERLEGCTALVCYNDEVAFALMRVLKKLGIRVPEDLSVASIDDSELAVLGDVKLTSIPYPMERLGVKAADNLLAMIKNYRFDGTYEFDVHVVERDSARELK